MRRERDLAGLVWLGSGSAGRGTGGQVGQAHEGLREAVEGSVGVEGRLRTRFRCRAKIVLFGCPLICDGVGVHTSHGRGRLLVVVGVTAFSITEQAPGAPCDRERGLKSLCPYH